MSYRFAVWHIPLLCVQWKTADDGQRNCPKHVEFYSKNKFEKSVHPVGFVIRIYHDGRLTECQTYRTVCVTQSVCGRLGRLAIVRNCFTRGDVKSCCWLCNRTNLTLHYLSSVYFANQPLHVSGIFVAHHQGVYWVCIHTHTHTHTHTSDTCSTHSNPANSQSTKNHNTYCTSCCIYAVYLLMMGYKYVRNM